MARYRSKYNKSQLTKKRKRSGRKYTSVRLRRQPRLTLGGIPNCKTVKLRYVESVTIDAAVGVLAGYSFRCNSIFDPNYSGTGHQPMYADTWNSIYRKNEVIGSKIKVVFSSVGMTNSNVDNVLVGIESDDSTGFDTTAHTQLENARTKYKVIYGAYSGKNTCTMSKGWSYKKALCGNLAQRSENQALAGALPDKSFYFHCLAGAVDGASNANPINAFVTIDYIVRFWERNDAPSS